MELCRRTDPPSGGRVAYVLPAGKDRTILSGAVAWADVLFTLERGAFANLPGGSFYGLLALKPGVFLKRERAAGRLKGCG